MNTDKNLQPCITQEDLKTSNISSANNRNGYILYDFAIQCHKELQHVFL